MDVFRDIIVILVSIALIVVLVATCIIAITSCTREVIDIVNDYKSWKRRRRDRHS